MGSQQKAVAASYLTIAETAKSLDRCTRTVRTYIKTGVLRARKIKGRGNVLWVRREDINSLKTARKKDIGAGDIKDLLRSIRIKIHSLEERMDFLMKVNGLDVSILRDQPDQMLIAIYDECSDFLELDMAELPLFQIENWATMFLQFSELEFERMVGPCQDIRPWKPFYDLCLGLCQALRRRKGFANNQKMQETYRLLDKSRKSLTTAITIFTESRAAKLGGSIYRVMLQLDQDDSLERYIRAALPKK